MKPEDIIRLRLVNQQIARQKFKKPEQIVAWMGAMQAQDYPAALWGVALRTPKATRGSVEKAIAGRTIVRTWPMRGTLHFVAPDDIRWMLKLMTPRILSNMRGRERQLGLTDAIFAKGRKAITKALEGGKELSRTQMYEVLEKAKLPYKEYRGLHIIGRLSQEGLLCFGPHQGKQPTFVLLDEWIPTSRELEGDEALAELVTRYFMGHGPATIQDLVWWSGLKVSDARRGIEAAGSALKHVVADDVTYYMSRTAAPATDISQAFLLPPFDEYIVGYRDRSAALDLKHSQSVVPGGNGMFKPIVVINGKVVGTWLRAFKKDSVIITVTPFEKKFSKADMSLIADAADRYGAFLGIKAIVS